MFIGLNFKDNLCGLCNSQFYTKCEIYVFITRTTDILTFIAKVSCKQCMRLLELMFFDVIVFLLVEITTFSTILYSSRLHVGLSAIRGKL